MLGFGSSIGKHFSKKPDSASALSEAKQNPDLAGYLTKEGHKIKNWKRRYFILKDNLLYYFKDRKDKNPVGVIVLDRANVQTAGKVTGKVYW